jgi:hypothetical protein
MGIKVMFCSDGVKTDTILESSCNQRLSVAYVPHEFPCQFKTLTVVHHPCVSLFTVIPVSGKVSIDNHNLFKSNISILYCLLENLHFFHL